MDSENDNNKEETFVTLRFSDVRDPESLKVDIAMLLESLGEEGEVVDLDEDD